MIPQFYAMYKKIQEDSRYETRKAILLKILNKRSQVLSPHVLSFINDASSIQVSQWLNEAIENSHITAEHLLVSKYK